MLKSWVQGAVAQLGERLVCNQEATGSIPVSSTKSFSLAIGGALGRALGLFVVKGDLSRRIVLVAGGFGLRNRSGRRGFGTIRKVSLMLGVKHDNRESVHGPMKVVLTPNIGLENTHTRSGGSASASWRGRTLTTE